MINEGLEAVKEIEKLIEKAPWIVKSLIESHLETIIKTLKDFEKVRAERILLLDFVNELSELLGTNDMDEMYEMIENMKEE